MLRTELFLPTCVDIMYNICYLDTFQLKTFLTFNGGIFKLKYRSVGERYCLVFD